MPETEARPRVKNRHGGAPRGERPTPRDARRLANAWCRVISALTRVHRPSKTGVNALNDALGTPAGPPGTTRTSLGAPLAPRFGVGEAKVQSPGAKNAPPGLNVLRPFLMCTAACQPKERADKVKLA